MSRNVAVVGGGAAGMMAAICASRAGASVHLYERNDRVGKKILATGNGKCNFSNEVMGKFAYYGSGASCVESFLKVFGVEETKKFFEDMGMRIKNRNGYLYPASEQASTVLDLLRYEMERLKVAVCCDSQVVAIEDKKPNVLILTKDGNRTSYDAVILACGGMAAPKTGSDGSGFKIAEKLGHKTVLPMPALTSLYADGKFWKSVAGVRCDANITLCIDGKETQSERGELQLTAYGISGIPVFQLSRQAAYALHNKKDVRVMIDFLPDYEMDEYKIMWKKRWNRGGEQPIEHALTGLANKKINYLMLDKAGIKQNAKIHDISIEQRKKLEYLFRRFEARINKTNSFDQAQTTAGGIHFKELSNTLASKLHPNIYFIGELVDIDAICGGYNLQWAWTSGFIAGTNAAKKI